ncbi:MAG: aminopeptidase N [Pseudomonadota bacterium]
MQTEINPTIRLTDYKPSPFLIDDVHLDVRLAQQRTQVRSKLKMRSNPDAADEIASLRLDGEKLELLGLEIDGTALAAGQYSVDESGLTILGPPAGSFTLAIETVCDPSANTALSGLYRSGGIYCTQCEAEGFRRITYYLDRPDVLARFTTRVEARRSEAPELLSNGNLIEAGEIEGTERHYAVWEDPHPKPSYLFALVAGDLAAVRDTFTTMSGREVELVIYVEPGKEDRCAWAMTSLKASMRWDEEQFGREYDLDIFMIVAVSDFNMGAMENKGLNVFNDKYILARPDTATDQDYCNIEAIIAHEYFHNWTGNRITCRDWFQLCLKEGLTVFRDQEFTSDLRSRPVKRISDVQQLRAHQFPEDAGPLAHPVRPDNYKEINNFYTATVYEKGAELCRMMQTMLGPEAFRAAMDLYFERHDGDAATVEDFVRCMEDAGGRTLSQFFRWYEQAGTPEITVESRYDSAERRLELKVSQTTAPSPNQHAKQPFHIPLAFGLLAEDGSDLPLPNSESGILELTEAEQKFTFEGIAKRPVISINRGFSAPVKVTANQSADEKLFLLANDSDPFNRWEAGQSYMIEWLARLVETCKRGQDPMPDQALSTALEAVLDNDNLENAFKIKLLSVPGEASIANHMGSDIDPEAIHRAYRFAKRSISTALHEQFLALYTGLETTVKYTPDAASVGRRALRNGALDYLVQAEHDAGRQLAANQASSASNLNDRMAALNALAQTAGKERDQALAGFYDANRTDHLLVDKWLTLHALNPAPDAVDAIQELTKHEAYSLKRPNKVRSLIGAFSMLNQLRFNDEGGAGYELVADVLMELDEINPQVAARISTSFRSWAKLEPKRRELAKSQLERIAGKASLSRDLREMTERTLKG